MAIVIGTALESNKNFRVNFDGGNLGRVDWPLAGPAPHRNPACGFSAPGSLQG